MARKFKIDEVLADSPAEERAEFDALCRNPGKTFDHLIAWLTEHGYKVSRGAVYNYRANFEEMLAGVRRSKETALAFGQVVKEGGNGVAELSEAALARFVQLMMEKLFQMETTGEMDSADLMQLSIALRGAVATKEQIDKIKAEYAARQANAVKAAEAAAGEGGGGGAVVAAIKAALGIGGGA